jgi:hypothetical protein
LNLSKAVEDSEWASPLPRFLLVDTFPGFIQSPFEKQQAATFALKRVLFKSGNVVSYVSAVKNLLYQYNIKGTVRNYCIAYEPLLTNAYPTILILANSHVRSLFL